jgi:hypothetical protein
MTTDQKIIKNKVGLPELAKDSHCNGNVKAFHSNVIVQIPQFEEK